MVLTGYNSENMFASIDECPSCGHNNAKIVDSRFEDTFTLRIRRKECKDCGRRWNTVEMTEEDFASISDLKETRDILILQNAVKQMEEQLSQLKLTMLNLTNASIKVESAAKNKSQTYSNMAKLYTNFK